MSRPLSILVSAVGYHHAALHAAWRQAQEPNFGLHSLPAYSPQLNPIERVWKLLRRLWIHNRFFPSLDELSAIVNAQLDVWAQPNSVLRRLCSFGTHG